MRDRKWQAIIEPGWSVVWGVLRGREAEGFHSFLGIVQCNIVLLVLCRSEQCDGMKEACFLRRRIEGYEHVSS